MVRNTLSHRRLLTLLQTEKTQIRIHSICLWKYGLLDPTLVEMKHNFFVLCANMKVYLYICSKWVEPMMNIHEGKGYALE